MVLRIGRIPFLVCAPFFHDFLGKEGLFPEYIFTDGAPSALVAALSGGSVHLAPASSFGYALAPQKFVLAPDLCTSCRLEVQSVELFSHYPMERLSSKQVFLTPQSATSIALFKVLTRLRFGISPEFVTDAGARDSCDAWLLIGDEALLEGEHGRFPYKYDLAALWEAWQGLPFVFGAWSIHRSALVPELRPLLLKFLDDTANSVKRFREDPASALAAWHARYPVNLPQERLKDYYNVLDYSFTDERKKSLALFFTLCERIGLISQNPPLLFL